MSESKKIQIERTQTGVRIEKRMLKVLKGLAEFHDVSLGDLIEVIVLHAFEGKELFSQEGLKKVSALKEVYEMDYGIGDLHSFTE